MSPPRLIICERTPRWLAAWRRALPLRRWTLLSSALSLSQCELQLREHPGSVVAVSVDRETFPAILPALHRWRTDFPASRALALCTSEISSDATAVALLREAGSLLTIDRAQQLPAAARLVQRHFRRHVATQLPWPEAVWQRLPWSRFAVNASPVTT